MPQQVCIFCGRARPLVTITKEHPFPRWVDRVLTPELLGPDRSFERTTAGPDGVATSKTWPAEVIAAIEATVNRNAIETVVEAGRRVHDHQARAGLG